MLGGGDDSQPPSTYTPEGGQYQHEGEQVKHLKIITDATKEASKGGERGLRRPTFGGGMREEVSGKCHLS